MAAGPSNSDWVPVEGESNEPATLNELYNINVVPSELFFKFRKQIESLRVGLNLEVRVSLFFSFWLIKFLIGLHLILCFMILVAAIEFIFQKKNTSFF